MARRAARAAGRTRKQRVRVASRLQEQGLTSKQIGARMNLAPSTVRNLLTDPTGRRVRVRRYRAQYRAGRAPETLEAASHFYLWGGATPVLRDGRRVILLGPSSAGADELLAGGRETYGPMRIGKREGLLVAVTDEEYGKLQAARVRKRWARPGARERAGFGRPRGATAEEYSKLQRERAKQRWPSKSKRKR